MKATSPLLNQPLRTEAQAKAAMINPMYCELRHARHIVEEAAALYSDYENGTTNERYALHMAICASDHLKIGMDKLRHD